MTACFDHSDPNCRICNVGDSAAHVDNAAERARIALQAQRVSEGLSEAPDGVIPRDTAVRAMLAFASQEAGRTALDSRQGEK